MTPSPTATPRALVLAALVALLVLPACDGGGDEATFSPDLVGRFEARERYTPLADALALTGLDTALRADGPFTVFAPTETAFRFLGSDFSPVLFDAAQRQTLAGVLRHHIVARRLEPADFTDGATFTALDGSTLTVRRIGPVVTVNGVTLDVSDPTDASNGVAYPLADVLLDGISTRERVRLSPSLSQVARGFQTTGVLAQASGRTTVLAPTNDAFDAIGLLADALFDGDNADILSRALRSHVLPGDVDLAALAGQSVTTLGGERLPITLADGVLTVGGVRVVGQERTADGRLYLVDAPILSALRVFDRLRTQPQLRRYFSDLSGLPALRSFLAAPPGPVTVFAPTDFAYNNRSQALNGILAESPQAALVRRLTAVHVVRGRYAPADLTDGLRLTAEDGTVLTVERRGTTVRLDGREIAEAPYVSPDGLVYPIDFFASPAVDLFDTLILRDFVGFARAVRGVGLETAYRTTVRTAFVVPNDSVAALVRLPTMPAILRRTATADAIPTLSTISSARPFTALNGETRAVVRNPDCVPGDRACSRIGLGTLRYEIPPATEADPPTVLFVSKPQLYEGFSTKDGRQTLHLLREIDRLPPSRP